MRFSRNLRHVTLAAVLSITVCGSAFAQSSGSYPSKPIRTVIIFPPGGSADVLPRVVGQKLAERWGQPWVFENRPGAAGQIAVDAVLRFPNDGYTLLAGTSGVIAINPSLYKKLAYDPLKDLVPVALIAKTPMALIVPAAWQGMVKDLIVQSRAKPGQLNYGHSGNGTIMHLIGEMFKVTTGADLTPVPFKVSTEIITSLAGGQLQAGWVDFAFALIGTKGGHVRAIAVAGKDRTALLPEVPTVAESGFPGFDMQAWIGFFARAGTSADIIRRLNSEVRTVQAMPEVQERIRANGNEPWWTNPEDFQAFVRSEIVKWAAAVKQSGASAD